MKLPKRQALLRRLYNFLQDAALQELQELAACVTENAECHKDMLDEELQRQTDIVHGFHQKVMSILPTMTHDTLPLSLADKPNSEPGSATSQ